MKSLEVKKMNVTTISNHVINTAASNMTTKLLSPAGYATVLAITAHVVAMIFGGGKCLTVVAAILTKPNVDKYSYLLIFTLLFACCGMNFVHGPLDIGDLLTHQYHNRHTNSDFLVAKMALYICLIDIIGIAIVLITLEAICRRGNCFGHVFKQIWPLAACLFVLAWSAILTIVLISKCVHSPPMSPQPSSTSLSSASGFNSFNSSNVRKDNITHTTVHVIVIFIFSIAALSFLTLLIQSLFIHWEGGVPHFRKKKTSLGMPEFLISQSQKGCNEELNVEDYDYVNEPCTSHSSSPSIPKLLTVSSAEPASIKGSGGMPATQQKTPQYSGNQLGINMAQVLGRRRHTICQISDSSTPSAMPGPKSKDKQYNYVRKFSVDISALQAQLQNPKTSKEAPFQSYRNLSKSTNDEEINRMPLALQPLKPLDLKLNRMKKYVQAENETQGANEKKVESPQSSGMFIPPPIIMVSNDDATLHKDNIVINNSEENENAGSSILMENAKPSIHSNTNTSINKDDCNHVTIRRTITVSQKARSVNTINTSSRPKIPTSLSLRDEPNMRIVINTVNNTNANSNESIGMLQIPQSFEGSSSLEAISIPQNVDDQFQVSGILTQEGDGYQLARLSAGLCLTFLITTIPVSIVYSMRGSSDSQQGEGGSFVSISTTTIAITTALQTIIYPHLISCLDPVVRRAVRGLKNGFKRICPVYVIRHDDNDGEDKYDDDGYGSVGARGSGCQRSYHVEDTSSTSPV